MLFWRGVRVGRRSTIGNRVTVEAVLEFESLSLRHIYGSDAGSGTLWTLEPALRCRGGEAATSRACLHRQNSAPPERAPRLGIALRPQCGHVIHQDPNCLRKRDISTILGKCASSEAHDAPLHVRLSHEKRFQIHCRWLDLHSAGCSVHFLFPVPLYGQRDGATRQRHCASAPARHVQPGSEPLRGYQVPALQADGDDD